jgi:FlaA1/EpsC-like NDP-sugar epimerase
VKKKLTNIAHLKKFSLPSDTTKKQLMVNLEISRKSKSFLMIGTDVILSTLSLWLAFALRFDLWYWPNKDQFWIFITVPILALPIFIKFGFYKTVVRYVGRKAMQEIFQATGLLVILWVSTIAIFLPYYLDIKITFPQFINSEIMFPRSIPILFWISLLLTIGGSRLSAKLLLLKPNTRSISKSIRNVLIYGAGIGGIELATSLSQNREVNILGMIDDDTTLKGHFIQDLQVLGDRTEIEKIKSKTRPLEVLLAMPSLKRNQRKELLRYLEDKKVSVRTMPSLNDLASGKAKMSDLQKVDITDLLGREEVAPNQKLLTACISEKTVLITGAGGSIGSELCRQILPLKPSRIVLLDHAEHNLYSINLELVDLSKKLNSSTSIVPVLGTISNKTFIETTIRDFKIDTVYHAAAYKHVTLLESNIKEGVLNNIFGTYNVVNAAVQQNIENFILISTDKAVRPMSVMGATKRITELIIQGLFLKLEAERKKGKKTTRFSIVRFGNVLGSSGSVIPLFQKQIDTGGPITITHPEVTRYFMTISEATQLVLQAGSIGKNCNIFILNMGEPVSILNLAKQMIYLSGHKLKTDNKEGDESGIDIQFIGLQKGEKIHEELFIGEHFSATEHPMIMKSQEDFCSWEEVDKILAALESSNSSDQNDLRKLLLDFSQTKNARNSTSQHQF